MISSASHAPVVGHCASEEFNSGRRIGDASFEANDLATTAPSQFVELQSQDDTGTESAAASTSKVSEIDDVVGHTAPQYTEDTLASKLRMWWPLLLGNILEWYEFGVYGYVSEYMTHNFFGGSSIGMWMGFAATFLSRPVGGILLGWLADRRGRQPVALLAMLGMMLATIAQGALPTGPVGCVLLVLLRLLQGISAGGEGGAVACYLSESAPRKSLALCSSLGAVSATFAFLLAGGTVALLSQMLGADRMLAWGWRLPFLMALPPGLVALVGRLRMQENADFVDRQTTARELDMRGLPSEKPMTIRVLFSRYFPSMLVAIGVTGAFATMFYVGPIWCSAYLKAHGMPPAVADWIGCAAHVVECIMILCGAALADRVGVGAVMLLSTVVTTVVALPGFALIQANPQNVPLAFLCLSLGFGTAAGLGGSSMWLFCAELYPASGRALGFGLTYNLAMSYFGGCGSIVAQALVRVTPVGPGAYISATGLLGIVAILSGLWLQARGHLQLAHIRPELYFFGPAGLASKADGTPRMRDLPGKNDTATELQV